MVDLPYDAARMVAKGKGILAADESTTTADKRLESYGIATGAEMRRKDRELFLNAPGVEEFLSGVILHIETLDQKGDDGVPFTESLANRNVLPGIKVDEGLEPFPESPKESLTQGLIGLADRLYVYKTRHNTAFTKWRAVVNIEGDTLPTSQATVENAKRLASYAFQVQSAGMVPMLEPEVLLDGAHSRMRCRDVLAQTMHVLVSALEEQAVDVSAVIVKTAMALSGNQSGRIDTPEEVAEATVGALMEAVPASVPGVVFLSGGQTPDQATRNLAAITQAARAAGAPWPLTFSYSRALQDEALRIWQGKDENMPAARAAFLERLKKVQEAIS